MAPKNDLLNAGCNPVTFTYLALVFDFLDKKEAIKTRPDMNVQQSEQGEKMELYPYFILALQLLRLTGG